MQNNDFFKDKFLILDGATGTVLQQNGLKPGGIPELLNIERPELITDIYKQYINAGSDVIYANTFGANPLKFSRLGLDAKEIISAGVALAKNACIGTKVKTALDIGPLGELLEPMGKLSFEDAYGYFCEIIRAGVNAGAELIVIETMSDLYEAKAALLAAKEICALPVFVTMSFEQSGRTFTGCTISSMAHTLEGLGADAIGFNCSLGPDLLSSMVKELAQNTSLPIIVKPNAGLPDPSDGHYDMTPEHFASALKSCIEAGATILGGCCGTSPEYIKKVSELAKSSTVCKREYSPHSFVCTPTVPVRINGVKIIGERINPTGKKRFQQALLQNDLDYILDVALTQAQDGADILDVNVGYPGIDEVKMLPLAVKKIQSAVDLPLMLDSSNPDALEAALRVYNGKPAVNSVNNDIEVQKKVLPLVKKYGASVVGLTLDSGGIPKTCAERVTKAKSILKAAEAYGIKKEDVWIDCLTLTVSAQQSQAKQTLDAVREIHTSLGLKTVLGVSNISFGLPERTLVTRTFLTEALAAGLTLPIVNPNIKEIIDTISAHRVLSGEDALCESYISRFAEAQDKPTEKQNVSLSTLSLEDAIMRGLKTEAAELAKEYLKENKELTLVENILIPSLDKIGALYEQGKAFLPQLLSAAGAAQSVFEQIKQSIAKKGSTPIKKGTLIIATVKGDIHDIGKNIVKTVLENYGYEVIDLGRDVPKEKILECVKQTNCRLVGLSALMTTTLPAMKETIELLKALPNPPAIFVGGAVLTEAYAREIGADYYSKDANRAVEIARKVLG